MEGRRWNTWSWRIVQIHHWIQLESPLLFWQYLNTYALWKYLWIIMLFLLHDEQQKSRKYFRILYPNWSVNATLSYWHIGMGTHLSSILIWYLCDLAHVLFNLWFAVNRCIIKSFEPKSNVFSCFGT